MKCEDDSRPHSDRDAEGQNYAARTFAHDSRDPLEARTTRPLTERFSHNRDHATRTLPYRQQAWLT